MNNSNSPPILEVLNTSRDATQAAEKPDDHKQLANQFGLKLPPKQLAESHICNLNGSHLLERKQKVLASHTILIICHDAQNYHHSNHMLGFRPYSKIKYINHCQKHVSPSATITTISSSHLGKLIGVFWGNVKEESQASMRKDDQERSICGNRSVRELVRGEPFWSPYFLKRKSRWI